MSDHKFREAFKELIIKYICPVCGYDQIESQPYDIYGNGSHDICDCCGFEFGYSEDFEVSHKSIKLPYSSLDWAFSRYREAWLENGAEIFMEEYYPSEFNKNGYVKKDILESQLLRINIKV
ncbi:hypothetical protein [Macrococcus carouselicus]|uniref:Uncharacterized protein n=1 Tax=Macrococcus carouselicus TaxID=69969 RepID=A0A9Q8FRT6_9STAP|nr:hypothetical protein [Macrococcus carouselicus]TDM04204.1 hypothetical protein ERX40_03275 [Macrococcus carouselicus]